MGFLRGAGRFASKLLLTAALGLFIVSVGMAEFTEYENLNAVFNEIIGSQMEQISGSTGNSEEDLQEIYDKLLEQCGDKESIEIPVIELNQTVTINCEELRENGLQSVQELATEMMVTPLFDQIYYKEYDCEFITCVQRGDVLVLFSEKGNEFFTEAQIYAAAATLGFAVLVILLSENWPDRFRGVGWSMVTVGLTYIFMEAGKIALADAIGTESLGGIALFDMLESMMAPVISMFVICLAAGSVMVFVGYTLRFIGKKKEVGIKKK